MQFDFCLCRQSYRQLILQDIGQSVISLYEHLESRLFLLVVSSGRFFSKQTISVKPVSLILVVTSVDACGDEG